MRTLIPALLAVAASTALAPFASAQELVIPIPSGSNGLAALIDPALGSVQVYRVNLTGTERRNGNNFLYILEELEKEFPAGLSESYKSPYSTLRIGGRPDAVNFPSAPQPGEIMVEIQRLTQPLIAAHNVKNPSAPVAFRMQEMEHAWWSVEHAYDGKLAAAVSGNYLMIGVPSKRTLVLYDTRQFNNSNGHFEMVAFRPMSGEMYTPASFGKSSPEASQILPAYINRMRQRYPNPDDLKKATESANEQLQALTLGPAVADASAPVAALPAPELWIGGLGSDQGTGGSAGTNAFVVVDAVGRRMYLYRIEANRIILKAARNLAIDLFASSIGGEHIRSTPLDDEQLNAVLSDAGWMRLAVQHRLLDMPASGSAVELKESLRSQLIALLAANRKSGGSARKPIEAIIFREDQVILTFTGESKLMTFDTLKGNALNLLSLRDYSIDQAITVLRNLIEARVRAQQRLKALSRDAGALSADLVRIALTDILKTNPFLVSEIENDTNFAKVRAEAWWQPLIDQAKAKAKEMDEQLKARAKPGG